MGVCKSTQNKNISLSTKAVIDNKNFPQIKFFLSTQSPLKFQTNCLLIFVDKLQKLKKDYYLNKVGKSQARRIQQFAKNSLGGKQIQHQQCLIFKNQIQILKFQFIGIVGVKVWSGRVSMHGQFRQLFIKFINETKSYNFQTLTILNPCNELGYPTNIISRGIIKDLFDIQKNLAINTINIIIKDQQQQSFYNLAIQRASQQGVQSVFQDKSINQSAYY